MDIDFSAFPFQFITNGFSDDDCINQTHAVLEGGCRWVQLRQKNRTAEELEPLARRVGELCRSYNAVFIIDDYVELCRTVAATGVHLGKNDMPPHEARVILGNSFIIGGTCNTISDVKRIYQSVDYIGCGPFRYTNTKKNLSPLLGLEGYSDILWQMRSEEINIPVVAIGGITVGDIHDILLAGPDGIALSGEITRAADMTAKCREIIETLNSCRVTD